MGSRLGGCFPLSGPPGEFVEHAYDELERRTAALILGAGQLSAVTGGGAAASAARERRLSDMAHTCAVRRDAGIRPARVAAIKAQLRWFGRIWAEPRAYPKGVIDSLATGCAHYADNPASAVYQRSPTALWLATVGRVEGSPWRTPPGGWTRSSILARLSKATPSDVAAYHRSASAHVRREDERAWRWAEGAHGADGAFTHRAAHALGGGRPPSPHWTALLQHDHGENDGEAARRGIVAMRTGHTWGLQSFLRRYGSPASEAWGCTRCGGGVDDVPHVLFVCPALATLQAAYAMEVRATLGDAGADALLRLHADAQATILLGGAAEAAAAELGGVAADARVVATVLRGAGGRRREAGTPRHEALVRATGRFIARVSGGAQQTL